MEPIRRAALVKATIGEIGRTGSLEVTVGQIARRAGVSAALAHHYFGSKEQLFLGAMRYTLSLYSSEVRKGLHGAHGHRARLEAIVGAGFTPVNFHRETIAAWLNFYVLAQGSEQALRLLTIYQKRQQSNLVYDLRPLVGARAPDVAQRIAALIDGLYLHHALRSDGTTGPRAARQVIAALDNELAAAGSASNQ